MQKKKLNLSIKVLIGLALGIVAGLLIPAGFATSFIKPLSGLQLTPNKRNGRKQAEHLRRITLLRDNDYPGGVWRNKSGRPSAAAVVQKYQRQHPAATKAEVIRGTGLSKPTVYKHYIAQSSREGGSE